MPDHGTYLDDLCTASRGGLAGLAVRDVDQPLTEGAPNLSGAETRDLIVHLADSLAWPLFAFVALWMLRSPLKDLSRLVEKIKYKDLELNFGRTLEETAGRADSIQPIDGKDSEVNKILEGALDPDPRIAVLKSWASVETAVEKLAHSHLNDHGHSRRIPTFRLIEVLFQAGVIDHSLASVLREMRPLRNLIAHGEDITVDDHTVRAFARAAARLALIIEEKSVSDTSR